jgi:hypothetical protein
MRFPGAVWRPGVNAGYRAGRSTMFTAVCHYTVGRDSRPIGDRGYFNFLVSRDGTVTQFAEADAVTWHAGNWNGRGPGIEVEYLPGVDDEVFTDAARDACGELVRWLGSTIPLDYYDAARINTWHGFIAHGSLIQSGDSHTDSWPRSDWDQMVGTAPPVKDDTMRLFHDPATDLWWLATSNEMIVCPPNHVWNLAAAGVPQGELPTATVGWLGKELPNGGGGTGTCQFQPAPTQFNAA